ncbi:hypothetical protein MOB40_03440 [Bacillus inaquosorum]|uniref:hypothetical protein n=1 Tax=Bacillus TaxID=1386 RepID=UPI0010E20107|nr:MULTISPECIES: hypothetical protein [Bacillus]TDO16459.1 hypothetical protein DFO69_1071 [Bacillus subtilis]MCE0741480.1 hypothetical protein [Bacillus sp. G16]MCY7903977.1 hypothetical protein [Bacillus inaquosorum]MCY7930969.1 hypothetical protein [Bacillus inaquosorum]MCY8769260.1 hypothetical protein [Bacillus inaquosorum]
MNTKKCAANNLFMFINSNFNKKVNGKAPSLPKKKAKDFSDALLKWLTLIDSVMEAHEVEFEPYGSGQSCSCFVLEICAIDKTPSVWNNV